MRGIALGRKNYLFMGSEGGGKSAAIIYTLIETAKLNNVDPEAWLTDALSRIADHKIILLDELMPWRYAAKPAKLPFPVLERWARRTALRKLFCKRLNCRRMMICGIFPADHNQHQGASMSRTALSYLKSPLWAAQLATGAKSFQANPIIGSPTLNRHGLHVTRIRIAEQMAKWRRAWMRHLISAEDREAFERDGFLIKKNALPDAEFETLREELIEGEFEAREMRQGSTVTRFIPLDRAVLERLPVTKKLVEGPLFQGLLRYMASFNAEPVLFLHIVLTDPSMGDPDPQMAIHSDTFQPTAKCWLFMHDIDEDEGPHTYSPGSHIMTPKRLEWEYKKSLTAHEDPILYHARGSFRATLEDLDEMGFPPPVPVTVPGNTFVVADIHGFHARAVSNKPTVRFGIYGSLRGNPYAPITGLDPFDLPFMRHRKVGWYVKALDWREKLGGRKTPLQPAGRVKPMDPVKL